MSIYNSVLVFKKIGSCLMARGRKHSCGIETSANNGCVLQRKSFDLCIQ